MARDGQDMVDAMLEPPGYTTGRLYTDEASAIEGWAEAYTVYFEGAESNSVPVTVSALRAGSGPKDAMKAAMTGLSTSGAPAIQAGIVAFWGVIVAAPAAYFSGATLVTPPPGLSTISTDILIVAPLNAASNKSAPEAIGAIVLGDAGPPVNQGIHILSLTGATATFPGPIVSPIL